MKDFKRAIILLISGVFLLSVLSLSGCASFVDSLIEEAFGSDDCVDDDWVWCDDDDGDEEWVLCEDCWDVDCCDDDEEDGC